MREGKEGGRRCFNIIDLNKANIKKNIRINVINLSFLFYLHTYLSIHHIFLFHYLRLVYMYIFTDFFLFSERQMSHIYLLLKKRRVIIVNKKFGIFYFFYLFLWHDIYLFIKKKILFIFSMIFLIMGITGVQ